MIVSAVDAAQDTAKAPVYVDAVGTQIIERIDWDQSTLTHEPQVLGQAAHLWSRISLQPQDVDVAELYDGFTMNACPGSKRWDFAASVRHATSSTAARTSPATDNYR